MPPPTPYLTLTVPQALSLPDPQEPERREYGTLVELFEHRAKFQGSQTAAGFQQPESNGWVTHRLSE